MAQHLHTAWLGNKIGLYRGDELIDSVSAGEIQRVVFVYRDRGQNPGDLSYAVVELLEDHLIFPADTGFAGRVLFERQAYWEQRACIFWVDEHRATLPGRLRRGRWYLRRQPPLYARLPRAELGPLLERWPLEGPQTWDQRKWARIQRSRPFADVQRTSVAPREGQKRRA